MTALKATKPPHPGTAYEHDFYTWTQEQGARLRAGDVSGLDFANLAEEVESLGRSQFDSLVSLWCIVLLHMLKYDHQPGRRTRSWLISIRTHRNRAEDILADNPGLKGRLAEAVGRAYRDARLDASKETRLALKNFPQICPYTLDDIRSRPFPVDPDDTTA
ncbi:hypothetical protein HNR00_001147 [Methylorubrum rhodinum]|uniref:DUF29 domain-containing protein n=1 Tax=Methylorubrum rhodinum TaxID=29428 RepID=A0A840ZFD5_9HYPH|nr:DUF29 domain-containing protein [Methylorubrum rhodinum]MBB5756449.1 hypothetical protein [Methylorubrum rhodinum]